MSLYLYGHLELFMLPLQLLGLRQRAGVYHAGIQHGLTITNPTQHLNGERNSDNDKITNRSTVGVYHARKKLKKM